MEGLAKSERSEDFGADRVLGLAFATASAERAPTDVGEEESNHGWLCSDASYRERSERGERSTLEERCDETTGQRYNGLTVRLGNDEAFS